MSLTTWIDVNIVQPVVDEILSPTNIEKITQAVVQGVVQGVLAGIGSGITGVSSQVVTQADRVISTTTDNVTGSLAELNTTMTNNFNGIVANVVAGIKSILPF